MGHDLVMIEKRREEKKREEKNRKARSKWDVFSSGKFFFFDFWIYRINFILYYHKPSIYKAYGGITNKLLP